ncbi:hypothetical protein MGSAQ_001180, partial [marine sediment metagenome]
AAYSVGYALVLVMANMFVTAS